MSTAKDIADVLQETDLDTQAANPESDLYKHWDTAWSKYLELQKIRRKADTTFDELRYTLELRRELARRGKKIEEVEGLIPAEHIAGSRSGPYERAYRQFIQSGYRFVSMWGKPKQEPGQMLIMPNDIIGAHLSDGTPVFFDKPVKPRRKVEEPVETPPVKSP